VREFDEHVVAIVSQKVRVVVARSRWKVVVRRAGRETGR